MFVHDRKTFLFPKRLANNVITAYREDCLLLFFKATGGQETANQASQQPLIPPPTEELEALYALTLRGDMDDIQDFATRLEQLDGQFAPFAGKLREFAKGFQDAELLTFVQQYREKKT